MSQTRFRQEFVVALHEIDAAGVMFFGHLFRHAHDAYEAFMADLGLPLSAVIQQRRWRLPLVHAEADYRAPLRHGERIEVQLAIAELGGSAFTVSYRFQDAAGGLRATAKTVHVNLAADGAGSAPLPQELRTALS
jgi:1,4-dihydroxy-2-naphthoyl-CoA hydrolase